MNENQAKTGATAPAVRPAGMQNPPNGTFNGLGVVDPKPQGGNAAPGRDPGGANPFGEAPMGGPR